MSRVCIVTGGTSGIGREAVRCLLENGWQVAVFSRRAEGVPGSRHFAVDVTDEAAVAAAVHAVKKEFGRIDGVINAAGFGISGAVEFTENTAAKKQFDVNFFGTVNVNKAVLSILREQGGGRIINISSVAAPVAIPFQAYYSAAKAAINAYTLALANEVRPFGISVCAVMPGDIRTGFTAAREKSPAGDDIYGGRISRSVAGMEKDEQTGMDPAVAGRFLCRTMCRRRVKPLMTFGLSYRLVCVGVKLLPARFANWVVGKLYAK